MFERITLWISNLSVFLSMFFLSFVAVVASVDNVYYFLHLLILLFTAVLVEKIKEKKEKLFWVFFIVGLLLMPLTKIIVEAALLVVFIELVVLFYKSLEDELEIIEKSLILIAILIAILWGVLYFTFHIYPGFLDNSITIKLSILYLIVVSVNFLFVMIYFIQAFLTIL